MLESVERLNIGQALCRDALTLPSFVVCLSLSPFTWDVDVDRDLKEICNDKCELVLESDILVNIGVLVLIKRPSSFVI